jgi:hypothetical protein
MKTLANKVELIFNFLKTDYEFKRTSKKIYSTYFEIVFKNTTTGISLHYDARENYFYVVIYKLIDGEIVENALPIKRNIPLDFFNLDYVIQFFEKEKYELYFEENYKNKSFDDIIKQYALDLVRYAGDMLSGDFKNFSEVEKIAKNKLINDLINTSWAVE